MNLSIVGRHLDLTDGMKVAINGVVEDIQKYNLDIIACRVIVDKDKKEKIKVEFNIQVAHKGSVVITQVEKDFYAALDLAKGRIEKVLRRYHDKLVDHHKDEKSQVEIVAYEENESDDIIDTPLDIEKPLSIDEAAEEFKNSGLFFMVYKDLTGEKRVIYKRKDGKLGLY
jgi:putative sigma-54 modulation protein